jgi:hypothetical protein
MDCLDDFLTAYLDLLIYSENELDHEIHVKKVLTRLRAAGLQADIKKCEFHVRKTKYLGFIVGEDGIEVDPEKISVLKNWQVPTTVRGIQSFLGFCNFYRRFIKNCGRIAKPLTKLTRKDIPFKFDEACQRAFRELKSRLLSAPVLIHYGPNRATKLETDSSDGVVGAVLSQLYEEDNQWHPVAFFLRPWLLQSAITEFTIRKCLLSSVRYRNIERNWKVFSERSGSIFSRITGPWNTL